MSKNKPHAGDTGVTKKKKFYHKNNEAKANKINKSIEDRLQELKSHFDNQRNK